MLNILAQAATEAGEMVEGLKAIGAGLGYGLAAIGPGVGIGLSLIHISEPTRPY